MNINKKNMVDIRSCGAAGCGKWFLANESKFLAAICSRLAEFGLVETFCPNLWKVPQGCKDLAFDCWASGSSVWRSSVEMDSAEAEDALRQVCGSVYSALSGSVSGCGLQLMAADTLQDLLGLRTASGMTVQSPKKACVFYLNSH